MELRQLEYFVAVARELHFGRAADKLHVAQPSVSQQIKALEQDLQVQLFERTSKGVTLSGPGTELLPLAARVIEDVEHLRRLADLSARRVVGQIRIGFLADEYAVPAAERLLTAIRRQHPRLSLEFQQLDFAEHHRALERGEVDVAFVLSPVPDTLTAVPLFEWPRRVAMSSAVVDRLPTETGTGFANQPVALPNQMASQAWRLAWVPASPEPGQTFVVGEDSMEAMLAVVGAGRAVCVVPEYVERFYPQPGVRFVDSPSVGPCTVAVGAARTRAAESQIAAVLRLAAATASTSPSAGTPSRRRR